MATALTNIEWAVQTVIDSAVVTMVSVPSIRDARRNMVAAVRGLADSAEQAAALLSAVRLSTPGTARSCEWFIDVDPKRYVRVLMHDRARDLTNL